MFISDHFKPIYVDNLGDISWKDKITIFLHGYYKAKEAGKKLGMNILMSAEISFEGNPNHYLVYGITKKFLSSYPEFCKKSLEEFREIAKKHNVFIIQAHPFRDDLCFPTPEYVDAMEVYNSNPRHNDYNEKALKFAKEKGLYLSAGSDAHRTEDVERSGILSKKEIKTAQDFIRLIKSGNAEIIEESIDDLFIK